MSTNQKTNSILETIKSLTTIEAAELAQGLEKVEDKVLSQKIQDILTLINSLTTLETAELVSSLEDIFGVAQVAVAAVAAGPVEEKTEFDVILISVGDKKLEVIKIVREVTSLGLKEAKDLVESTDTKVIKTGIKKDEATTVKAKFEAVGAKAEIK